MLRDAILDIEGSFVMSVAELQEYREEVRKKWLLLNEEEKSQLLPELLNSMNAWHGWSFNDTSRLIWLEDQFKKAGIPFRSRT
jgi:hypothetical protein